MKPSLARFATILALSAGAATMACAAPDTVAQNDLYIDAIRSLNEGRQNDASAVLMRMVEQEPQHAGAWLDLAIIQCELGRAEEAERLFTTIETRFSPPPVILEVIAKRRAQGCQPWKPRTNLSFMSTRGYDTNVNQGASNPNFSIGASGSQVQLQLLPEYLPRSDQYTAIAADYLRDLNNNGTIGFVQGRVQVNDALTEYNTMSVAVGIEQPWRISNWSLRGTGVLAALGLGGQLYQRQAQMQLRATPPLNLPAPLQFHIISGLNHIEYATLQDYNSNILDLRGLMSYRTGPTQVQASLGYSVDRASSARPGGDRRGWLSHIGIRTQLPYRLNGELGWTRQTWQADTVYSPGFIDERRHQNTKVMRGVLSYPINKQHSVNMEIRVVKNAENISLFQYDSRQVQLSWQWQGF